MLAVNETFYSIQGEGLQSGLPMYFIRLQGCSVGCHFCDTKESWKQTRKLTFEESLITQALAHNIEWICITGGEPTEQDLEKLTNIAKEQGLRVHLETAGTCWQERVKFDWVTLSPKNLYSKKKTDNRFLTIANEIKCVVTSESDLDHYLETYSENMRKAIPLILQPVDNNQELALKIMDKLEGVRNARLMLQTHKILHIE